LGREQAHSLQKLLGLQMQGGEILVSSLLKELRESAGDIAFRGGRHVELKGLAGQHRVFTVRWE
jgi:class 3 adenylate cyclase